MLVQNNFILGKPSVVIFADIYKTLTIFTKTIFEDSKKLKILEIMYQNEIYICISRCSNICLFPVKKMVMPAELKGCVT